MKTSRMLTLLAVFILSMVLVTAVLAAASSTRQSTLMAEKNLDVVQIHELSIPEVESAAPAPATQADAVNTVVSESPKIAYRYGLPPDPAFEKSSTDDSFDPTFRSGPDGAFFGAQGSGIQPLSLPPLPRDDNIVIDMDSERVWGVLSAGEPFTVSVNGIQMGAGSVDNAGFFWTTLYDSNGDRPGLNHGDEVKVFLDGTPQVTVTLPQIVGYIDSNKDLVLGQLLETTLTDVTVYASYRNLTSYWVTTTVDASGYFTADFSTVFDLKSWANGYVAAVDDGVEIHSEVFAFEPSLLVQPIPFNLAMGSAENGSTVTVTLLDDGGSPVTTTVLTTDENHHWQWEPKTDIEENYVVQAELSHGGPVLTRTIDKLTINYDPANDRVMGETLPFAYVRSQTNIVTADGWKEMEATTTADSSGNYTVQFSADLSPRMWAGVFVADDEGDDLNLWTHDAFMSVNQTDNYIWGWGPSPPGESDLRQVTITLASTDTQYVTVMNWSGRFEMHQDDPGIPEINPGEVVTVEVEGYTWQTVVPVNVMTATPDVENDWITGEVNKPTGKIEALGSQWGWEWVPPLYPIAGNFEISTTANSPYTVTSPGFDIRNAVNYEVRHYVSDDGAEAVSGSADFLRVYPMYNGFLGTINPPDTLYTVTLKDGGGGTKGVITGTSMGPSGWTDWRNFWDVESQMEYGDRLEVHSEAGFDQVIDIPAFDIQYDLINDRITGNVLPNVLLYVEVSDQGEGFVPTDVNGDFAITIDQFQNFYEDGDLAWGNNARVCYATNEGNHICVYKDWPDITARYTNMGWNDVFGNNAIPDNQILITVTNDVGADVGSGETVAGKYEWQSPVEYQLDFEDGTIISGNRVTVDFGDDFIDYVDVVSITVEPDMGTGFFTVTVPPSSTIYVNVNNRWGDHVDNWDEIEVDGSGIYSFDLSGRGIEPGDEFHVYVQGNHNHGTEYIHGIPYAELSINKRGENGHPMPGFPYIYQIEFSNESQWEAENVIITDMLPLSTTYAGDTSGFTPEDGGDVITWTFGSVDPWSYNRFYVAVDVDSSVSNGSNLGQNCAWISTTTLGDEPDNNGWCSGEPEVGEGETGLGVDKYSEPGDPHPGQTFQYVIDYYSNGGVATGPAWLTDTLPEGTTVEGWYDENGWDDLWTDEYSTDEKFVLYAPAGVPGDMGGRIRLTLLLTDTADIGDYLSNHVVITTTNKVDDYPDDNERLNEDARVSEPRHDLYIEKSINSQVPIPGEWLNYFIYFSNNGNIETNVTLTDTLDEGLIYQDAHWGGNQPFENDPFPEPTINGNELVWDLGNLGVAEGKWFHIQVSISDTLIDGESVTNCIVISGEGAESTPGDNESCVSTTLNSSGPNLKVTKQSDWEDDNQVLRYWVNFENIGDEDIDDVWLTDTLPISVSVEDMWMEFDDQRQITHTENGRVNTWEFEALYSGDSGTLNMRVRLDDPNDRPKWYTNTAEITDIGEEYSADNYYEDVAFLGEIQYVDLIVNSDHSDMWGESQPGRAVTVTTAVSTTYAYWNGDCDGCWNADDIGPIWPGDVVTVTSGDGVLPVIFSIPDPFEALADSENNQVTGQIDNLNDETIDMNVHGGDESQTQTDDSGHFTGTLDIPRGAQGEVRWSTTEDYANVTYHSNWTMMDLIIRVNYGHDWISGNYDEGYTVWLTVTKSDSITVKGTAQLETGYPQDWNDPGFSTENSDWDGGQAPDIQEDDWVFGYVEPTSGGGSAPLNGVTGYETEVQVGTISGNVDVDGDQITGTVAADWLGQAVDGNCEPWGSDGGADSKQFNELDPDGVDVYTCSWAGDWDLQPGMDIGVEYYEPDGDSVMNVFYEPTAYLQIEKWAEGNPGVGGNFTFYIRYRNDGEANAENVFITDTLSAGMSYLMDTLPVGVMTTTNEVIWDLGTVSPGKEFQFEVYVDVKGNSGDWITNTVLIATSSFDQGEPEEKTAQTSREILANSAEVNIGKEPWTGDPAPGEKFIWMLNACNNGDTGSSMVTLTDTIPISTTLEEVRFGGNGWWTITDNGDEYALSRHTLDSYRCEEVYLVFEVDPLAEPGQLISNTAVITASNDTDPDNNEAYSEVWVNDPHTNLSVEKWWNWGQLVPGGEASYGIEARNNGNTGVTNITMTDTLPVDSSLVGLWQYDLNWNNRSKITYTTAGRDVIWDVESLIPGEYKNYEIQIQFDTDILTGTVITNSVVVEHQPDEDRYDDNYAERVDEIFDHGPNLRITKHGDWEDHGGGVPVGAYQINVENVGDEAIGPVVISDTYPTELQYQADSLWSPYFDSDRDWDFLDHPGQNYFTVTLQELDPSEGAPIWFRLYTDTLGTGLTLTNTAMVMTDDGTPDDNEDSAVLTTGPDLWVEKELISEDFDAGDEITFELRFGNDIPGHHWWWNIQGDTWLTDTLPVELTFITATVQCDQGWCGYMPNINGNEIGWEFGQMNAGEQQVIHLTVKITDTVGPADTFTNTAVVSAEQSGENGEVDTDNNTGAAGVTMPCTPITDVSFTVAPDFILVGETVTFTLTITPTGASTPITTTLDMGDDVTIISNSLVIPDSYADSGYMVVGVDVENACSFVSADDKTIWVASDQIFLPLILR